MNLEARASRDRRFLRALFTTVFLIGVAAAAWVGSTASLAMRVAVALLTGIEVAGYFGIALVVWSESRAWRATSRFLPSTTLEASRAAYTVSRPMKVRRDIHGFGVVMIAAIAIGFGVTFSWRFAAFGLSMLAMMEFHFQSSVRRPIVTLFLSTSTAESVGIQASLKRVNMDYRVVALLDTYGVLDPREASQAWSDMVIGHDSLRTADPNVWRTIVALLIKQVPLVVMDVRTWTPHVAEELRQILNAGAAHKTLFLARPNGEAPALAPLAGRASELAIVSAEHAEGVYGYLIQNKANLPAPDRPLVATVTNLRTLEGSPVLVSPVAVPAGLGSFAEFHDAAAVSGASAGQVASPPSPAKDERKCQHCGWVYDADREWCPRCGTVYWFNIVAGFLTGIALVVIGLFYATSYFWKALWLVIGALNVHRWGTAWIRAARHQRRWRAQQRDGD